MKDGLHALLLGHQFESGVTGHIGGVRRALDHGGYDASFHEKRHGRGDLRCRLADRRFDQTTQELDEDIEDACVTLLSEVLPAQNRRPRFSYEYDFGDEWIHQLIVEERLLPKEGVKYPMCVGGQRACPPEDRGGPWAYPDFVEGIGNPDHPRHDELPEWVVDEFDPERFDQEAVNTELRRLRTRRA